MTVQLIDKLCATVEHILRCIAVGAETSVDAWCMSEDDSGGRAFRSPTNEPQGHPYVAAVY